MKLLRTGWDIDGVGFTFSESCYNYLKHIGLGHLWKSGPNPKPYWNWYHDWGWTDEQFVQFCHDGADAGFIFAGPMREGYRESIEAVVSMGHEIIIVTDRSFGTTPRVSQKLTADWFAEHEINYDELWFSADKTVANCDTFIDDKLQNYDALDAAGVDVYLLNRAWNEVEGGDDRRRIDTLQEYVDIIAAKTYAII